MLDADNKCKQKHLEQDDGISSRSSVSCVHLNDNKIVNKVYQQCKHSITGAI